MLKLNSMSHIRKHKVIKKALSEPKIKNIKELLLGIYIWSSAITMTFTFASLIIISFPFVYLFDRERHSLHRMANGWAKGINLLNPWWKFELTGRENLAKNGQAAVYVANHQSQADILALFMLSTRFRWLSKASLFKLPLVGWGMSAVGYVPVSREDKLSREKCMKLSAEHLKKGTPMVFFPEGTRSKTGELSEFKMGAFRLAKSLNVPIIPVTLEGCKDILPKGAIVPKKARVEITIHKPIFPENLTAEELMNQAKNAISEKLKHKSN